MEKIVHPIVSILCAEASFRKRYIFLEIIDQDALKMRGERPFF